MSTFDDKCYNCGMIIDEMDDSDYDIWYRTKGEPKWIIGITKIRW
jgi:nitrous oxide reductase accessory protein NosL